MTEKPYELLVRFNPDGTTAGASVRSIVSINGKDFELDPVPLSDATDPAFTKFAEQFAASALADLEAARKEIARKEDVIRKLHEELAAMGKELESAQTALHAVVETSTVIVGG